MYEFYRNHLFIIIISVNNTVYNEFFFAKSFVYNNYKLYNLLSNICITFNIIISLWFCQDLSKNNFLFLLHHLENISKYTYVVHRTKINLLFNFNTRSKKQIQKK
jgi:hypothetical protein